VFGVVFGKHPPQNFPFIQRASGHIGGSVGDFLVKLFPDNQNQHLVRLLMKNQSEVPLTSYIHVLGAKISESCVVARRLAPTTATIACSPPQTSVGLTTNQKVFNFSFTIFYNSSNAFSHSISLPFQKKSLNLQKSKIIL